MKSVLTAAAALTLLVACTQAAEPQPDKDGFYSLFDGKSLEGWKVGGNEKSFYVEDGKLVAASVKNQAHLFYDGPVKNHVFKSFVFKADVMTMPGANAGIYIHTGYQEAGWPKKGYEIQVNVSHGDPKKSGGLYGIKDCFDPPCKDNVWYTQEIAVAGKRIVSKIDGKLIFDYTEPDDVKGDRQLAGGTFALQAHDPKSKVFFKNILVKPLAD
jgi:hypothetical protein